MTVAGGYGSRYWGSRDCLDSETPGFIPQPSRLPFGVGLYNWELRSYMSQLISRSSHLVLLDITGLCSRVLVLNEDCRWPPEMPSWDAALRAEPARGLVAGRFPCPSSWLRPGRNLADTVATGRVPRLPPWTPCRVGGPSRDGTGPVRRSRASRSRTDQLLAAI